MSCVSLYFVIDYIIPTASFPNKVASIYSSVVMVQCRHFPNCNSIPASVRKELARLKKSGNGASSTGTKRQDFWTASAIGQGFIDTDGGVRFVPPAVEETVEKEEEDARTNDDMDVDMSASNTTTLQRMAVEEETAVTMTGNTTLKNVVSMDDEVLDMDVDMNEEMEAVVGTDNNMGEKMDTTNNFNATNVPRPNVVSPFESIIDSNGSINYERIINGSSLVTLEERDLVPDYIFLALGQLVPCKIDQDDRIGVYSSRPVGFQGMCCRHVSYTEYILLYFLYV